MNSQNAEWCYSTFNYLECLTWISIGSYFLFRLHSFKPAGRGWICVVILTFILFGISDYYEAQFFSHVPYWLWAWKLACGAVLVRCRYGYLGIDRRKFYDSYSLLGTILLLMFLLLVFWQVVQESER